MGLKSTRKILSIVLAIVIAFSIASAVTLLSSKLTVGNEGFYSKMMATSEVASECEKQLKNKYEVLAVKSGIPAEVFTSVTKQYDTRKSLEQATQFLFDDNSSSLQNGSRARYFNEICVQYLDANNISHTSDEIETVSKEAEQIYCDAVGLHALDYVANYTVEENSFATKTTSFFVMLFAICIVAIFMMYRKRMDSLPYIAYGVMGGGLSQIICGVLRIVFKVNQELSVEPEVYNQVFKSMNNAVAMYQALAGTVVLLLGVAIFIFYAYHFKQEKLRKESRFKKIVVA